MLSLCWIDWDGWYKRGDVANARGRFFLGAGCHVLDTRAERASPCLTSAGAPPLIFFKGAAFAPSASGSTDRINSDQTRIASRVEWKTAPKPVSWMRDEFSLHRIHVHVVVMLSVAVFQSCRHEHSNPEPALEKRQGRGTQEPVS
jgi:hypothetical protein